MTNERRSSRPRTAVVTGGVSGLGLAATERLRAHGVTVITADVDAAAQYIVDVGDPAAVGAFAAQVGEVDILVNSAGVTGTVDFLWNLTDTDWERVLRINLTGTFNLCRAFAPRMAAQGWGRIINVASMAGKEGNAKSAAYSASKAGVIALTKSLGKELASSGVLVNAIAPGVFETPILKGQDPELLRQVIDKIPMGRIGRPEEAAELIAWLASDSVSFSTGFTYDLSGGRATY